MKKLTAVFAVFIFILTTVSAFAADSELKKFERSPFNVWSEWIASFGQRADGTSMMKVGSEPTSLAADEIRERRRSMGVVRGMGKYE